MASTGEQETAWTVRRLLDWTIDFFEQRQVEGGRLAAELLLARAMGCRKIDLYTRHDAEPTDEQRTAFRELIRQAGEHTPIAYLLGTKEFFSLEFAVSPAVLVPRPETEALVQRTIELCRAEPERMWHILDVGTGSGCIAVAIAHYATNARVVATDISSDILAVATTNIDRHHVSDRVKLIAAAGVALPANIVPQGGFDLVVSNPPYIRPDLWNRLPPNIRNHEPRIALVPDSDDGLEMYRRFASDVPAVLAPAGRLLVEIGYDQHKAVQEIFATAAATAVVGWTCVGSHRNPTDPHDRVIEFEFQPGIP